MLIMIKGLTVNVRTNVSKLLRAVKRRRQRKQEVLLQLALMSGSVRRIK